MNPNSKKRRCDELAPADGVEERQLQQVTRKRKDFTTECLAFLDSNTTIRLGKCNRGIREPPKTLRRCFPLSVDRHVVELRYGGLESIDRVHRTATEVFRLTGVKPSAQYMMIKRWLQRGKRFVSLASQRGREHRLSEEQRAHAANPKTLMQMRHLSLEQRALQLKQEFNLPSLAPSTVRACYHEFNVRFRKPQTVYKSKNERARDLLQQQ